MWFAIYHRRRGELKAERFSFGVEADSAAEAVRVARVIRAREAAKRGLRPKRVGLEARPWPGEEGA